MTWRNGVAPSRGLPSRAAVADATREVLDYGRRELRGALEDGTPVRTGRMRSSWVEDGNAVRNVAPYGEHVDVDTTRAEGVVEGVDRAVGQRVDELFRGGAA